MIGRWSSACRLFSRQERKERAHNRRWFSMRRKCVARQVLKIRSCDFVSTSSQLENQQKHRKLMHLRMPILPGMFTFSSRYAFHCTKLLIRIANRYNANVYFFFFCQPCFSAQHVRLNWWTHVIETVTIISNMVPNKPQLTNMHDATLYNMKFQ